MNILLNLKKIGMASPMHQDNFYWNLKKPNSFTMWIAIDKAKKNNGAVEYLAGSHKNYTLIPILCSREFSNGQKINLSQKKI